MPQPSVVRRCRYLGLAVAVLLIAACTTSNSSAADDAARVNQFRSAHGVHPLPRALELDLKAQVQAQRMANAGTIFHSVSLTSGVSPGWQLIGENVAVAGSIAQAEAALEASPPHRENLLDPYFTQMGIGAVQVGNRVFVVQEFVQR
jgi:uncharacterized protein YkwD